MPLALRSRVQRSSRRATDRRSPGTVCTIVVTPRKRPARHLRNPVPRAPRPPEAIQQDGRRPLGTPVSRAAEGCRDGCGVAGSRHRGGAGANYGSCRLVWKMWPRGLVHSRVAPGCIRTVQAGVGFQPVVVAAQARPGWIRWWGRRGGGSRGPDRTCMAGRRHPGKRQCRSRARTQRASPGAGR